MPWLHVQPSSQLTACERRLPSTMSGAEKAQRVETVIKALGLRTCRDTIIGGAFRRRASLSQQPPCLATFQCLTRHGLLQGCVRRGEEARLRWP